MKVYLGLLVLLTAAFAVASDEDTVRLAYAKTGYAVYLTTAIDLPWHSRKLITTEELKAFEGAHILTFQLSEMKSGPISEVLDRKLSELLGARNIRS